MTTQIDLDLTEKLRNELLARGASLVGFADLQALPEDARDGFPRGILIGIALEKDVLRAIDEGPTPAYHELYDEINDRLDALDRFAEGWLAEQGYRALGKTRQVVGSGEVEMTTKLPHKTVATHAGVGWIGKCALLVTPEFGSGLRISSILTDAPLETGTPIRESRCGTCTVCGEICPAQAVSGTSWSAGLPRDAFWDAAACKATARARSKKSLGKEVSLCGRCILRCPWTQKYLAG